ncbi:polyketide synthase dehydratase domain-containing protein, partial [Actinomadura sp. CNU-125]|uniref:polyketide synthase dehydratase domain-containing protein n=1 Tax=Actinomadura sp. CNU-125 TaxID=1904961 RepID=UPI0021CCF31A
MDPPRVRARRGAPRRPRPTGRTPTGWPPEGAEPVDDPYGELAAAGYDYGPAFQGVRAAWRDGRVAYADVRLDPDENDGAAARFGMHPALLDAALHVAALPDGTGGPPRLPFAWTGVTLRATGAAELRVRAEVDGDTAAITATDPSGARVLEIERLVLRRSASPAAGRTAPLLAVEWTEATGSPSAPDDAEDWTELAVHDLAPAADSAEDGAPDLRDARDDQSARNGHTGRDGGAGRDVAVRARGVAERVLGAVQEWLAEHEGDTSRLVVTTRGAVAARPGADVPGLAESPVWGLVQSAQAEHPGRLVLLDVDDAEESRRAIPAALATGEPRLALRDGTVLVPRLARATSRRPRRPRRPGRGRSRPGRDGAGHRRDRDARPADGRHLVAAHGARHLLLAGRRGAEA